MTDKEITLGGRVVLLREHVAKRVQMKPSTWDSYVSRGWPRANPAPKPDDWIDSRRPVWYPETVDAWDSQRPSKGRAKRT